MYRNNGMTLIEQGNFSTEDYKTEKSRRKIHLSEYSKDTQLDTQTDKKPDQKSEYDLTKKRGALSFAENVVLTNPNDSDNHHSEIPTKAKATRNEDNEEEAYFKKLIEEENKQLEDKLFKAIVDKALSLYEDEQLIAFFKFLKENV